MIDQQPRILVIDDAPENLLPILHDAAPEASIFTLKEDESVSGALERVQPSIVFGLHGVRYPAQSHAVALDCPSVKWLHNGGAGIDHLHQWDPLKITVTNSAGVSSHYMAESVTGAILMINFGFPAYLEQQKAHHWQKIPWQSLSMKTVLIVGLGGIGQLVAQRLQTFGAYVIGARRSTRPCEHVDEQINMTNLLTVVPQADYICIHVPNTDETQNLVDAEFLNHMKPTAHLINTARGAQVDEIALIDALKRKRIAGAYLDVFRTEPLPDASPLWDLEGVIISPHNADASTGWKVSSTRFFAENLRRYLRAGPLKNICDPAKGY